MTILILSLFLAYSCAESEGTEGKNCYPNGTCNSGLECLSGKCVRLPIKDSGSHNDGQNNKCCSVSFNGASDQVITVENKSILNPLKEDFTIEMWIKPELMKKANKKAALINKRRNMEENYYQIGINALGTAGKYEFGISFKTSSGWIEYTTKDHDIEGKWTHLVTQRSSKEIQLWINGIKAQGAYTVRSGSINASDHDVNNSGKVWIGNHSSPDWQKVYPFYGKMYSVRISKGAIYKGTSFIPEKNLLATSTTTMMLDFNTGKGTLVPDKSGNTKGGEIKGCSWENDIP